MKAIGCIQERVGEDAICPDRLPQLEIHCRIEMTVIKSLFRGIPCTVMICKVCCIAVLTMARKDKGELMNVVSFQKGDLRDLSKWDVLSQGIGRASQSLTLISLGANQVDRFNGLV